MKEKRCNWSRGKLLGGSSSINGMVYLRGNKADYDHWASLGNPGWSYEEVLPYFVKSEDNNNKNYTRTRYHGTGGYQSVQDYSWKTPLVDAFVQAGQEMGYKIRDLNGESPIGFMYTQGTNRGGTRCSASKAFLRPVRNRKNLHISKNSFVTKILIDPATKRAEGVTFIKGKRTYRIKARKEVILSAGSTASPQILMLSGVGIREHLEEHRIPVVSDLKVGDNLQDHAGFAVTYLTDQPVTYKNSRYATLPNIIQYISKKTGPMTTSSAEGVAFIKTKFVDASQEWPDIQLLFIPLTTASAGEAIGKSSGQLEEVYDTLYKPIEDAESFQVIAINIRPKSRGTIRLNSSNPFDHPLINPRYFSDKRDMEALIEGAKFGIQMGTTPAFQKYNARLHDTPIPRCEGLAFGSEEYLTCGIRQLTYIFAHTVGTCKMGPSTDPDAVVDPRLKVYGVQGLRVIDAGIMPTVTGGNINGAVIMIAEKGADMIKEDWKR